MLSGTTVTNFAGVTEGTVHADSGSTVELDAATIQGGNVTIAGALDSLGSSFIDDGAAITGAGTVTVSGGTLTLSDANTYTGVTTINGGSLALSGSGSIADSIGVTINGTGNLNITAASGNESIITLSGVSGTTVTLGANTLILTDASGDYEGDISGTGGLTLTGRPRDAVGHNSYSGATTIDGGTLALSGAGSIGASSDVADDGTFTISGLTNGGTSIIGLSGDGTVTLGGNTLTLSDAGEHATDTFSGAITGTGGLTLTTGTETLSGDNGYSGTTTINGGTLALSGTGSIGASADVADDGTFDISGPPRRAPRSSACRAPAPSRSAATR